jgi:hypothetical protein
MAKVSSEILARASALRGNRFPITLLCLRAVTRFMPRDAGLRPRTGIYELESRGRLSFVTSW